MDLRVEKNDPRFFDLPKMTNSAAAALTDRCSFRRYDIGIVILILTFPEQLTDDVFNRDFLHVYVAYIARIKELPAGFSDSSSRNF